MYEDIEWATNATEDSNKRKNEQFLLKNEQRIGDQLVKRQNWYQMPIYGLFLSREILIKILLNLRIVWKLDGKSCSEHSDYRLLILKPNAQKSENNCSNHGCKKSSPVISDCKVDTCYFNTEQNTT